MKNGFFNNKLDNCDLNIDLNDCEQAYPQYRHVLMNEKIKAFHFVCISFAVSLSTVNIISIFFLLAASPHFHPLSPSP